MGAVITRLRKRLFQNREVRILMVGLDASGKTTILYKLKLGEVVMTVPTIGMLSDHLFIYIFWIGFYSENPSLFPHIF